MFRFECSFQVYAIASSGDFAIKGRHLAAEFRRGLATNGFRFGTVLDLLLKKLGIALEPEDTAAP